VPADVMVITVASCGALGVLLTGLAAWRRSLALLLAAGFLLCGGAAFVATTFALA
jgi:hypothetical protein